jgi:F-type H+-transporting ATPase subunit alpha
MEHQVVIIWTGTKGYIDDVATEDLKKFEEGLISFVENSHPGLLEKLRERKKLDEEIEGELKSAVTEFKGRFASDARSASA